MAFPTNPNDNDLYESSNGIVYIYDAADDAWRVYGYKNFPLTGPQGETGAEGLPGLQGVTGIQGETGKQGVQGETGLSGEAGAQGTTGYQGITGASGVDALQGETGLSGVQGETGIQGETGVSLAIPATFTFQAADFDNPNSSDWAVNVLAPAAADSNNAGISVRLFDDTTEEGVGFMFTIPSGTTSLKFYFKSRAETAPVGAVAAVPRLYHRDLNDNAAIDAWSSGTDFTALAFPTNENWQYDEQTITLSTLGLTAGELVQFELTRNTASGSDDLTGDWALVELRVEPI